MRVGISDHLGWAVVVTVSGGREVVDRRRMELVEPGLSEAPIHYDRGALDDAACAALVDEVRTSIARVASAGFDELVAAVGPVTSISLRTWPDDFPQDIATQRRPPYEARADAIMYRQVLAEIAHERGWEVHRFDAKQVLAEVGEDVLQAPRRLLGPPWTKDHRTAYAAAIVAAAR